MNRSDRAGDLARDKSFAAYRTFMIEQNPVRSVDAIGLTIVHGYPVSVEFRCGVRTARLEWRRLVLRGGSVSIELGRGCLIEARFPRQPQKANGFEQA